MEFIRYARIVFKRWWLTAGLLAVVAVVSVLTFEWDPPSVYSASFRVNVGLEPVPPDGAMYEYNPLDVWMTSEYFMDDLASAVRGAEFAGRVSKQMGEGGPNPVGAFSSSTEHRVLMVSIVWGDDEELASIANAAVEVLEQQADDLVGALGRARPVLRLIDPPVVVPAGSSLKDKLDIPIRLGLAVIAGIAGAFLVDYLDLSVRDVQEVEAMGIAVLARIPRRR